MLSTTKRNLWGFILFTAISSLSTAFFLIANSTIADSADGPEQVFRMFWMEAYAGNLEGVRRFGGLTPNDFHSDCTFESGSMTSDSVVNAERLKRDEPSNSEESDVLYDRHLDRSVLSLASSIRAGRIRFDEIRIVKRREFKDEALLAIRTDSNLKFQYIAFVRSNARWTIVAVLIDSDLPSWWDRIRFATERERCKPPILGDL